MVKQISDENKQENGNDSEKKHNQSTLILAHGTSKNINDQLFADPPLWLNSLMGTNVSSLARPFQVM